MLARIIPIIGFDRDMVRLEYERLPQVNFPLTGLKKVVGIMEKHFKSNSSSDDTPSVTLQFSPSTLDTAYRNTNNLLVEGLGGNNDMNYRQRYRTLLDNGPPGTTQLEAEGSGCGLIAVFIEKSIAEFSPLVLSDADETFLRGLEDNLLKVSSDFYWAWKLATYVDSSGVLTADEEIRLEADLRSITNERTVDIPDVIVPPLLSLLNYILKGTFLLNRLATGQPLSTVPLRQGSRGSRKRYRIVDRLSQGAGRNKKRRFYISKLLSALNDMGREELTEEVRILQAHAVVNRPTNGSVALERNLSNSAVKYLKDSCEFKTDENIAHILQANDMLAD